MIAYRDSMHVLGQNIMKDEIEEDAAHTFGPTLCWLFWLLGCALFKEVTYYQYLTSVYLKLVKTKFHLFVFVQEYSVRSWSPWLTVVFSWATACPTSQWPRTLACWDISCLASDGESARTPAIGQDKHQGVKVWCVCLKLTEWFSSEEGGDVTCSSINFFCFQVAQPIMEFLPLLY